MAVYDINGTVISSGGSGGSPLADKRVLIIGDSNMQYSGDQIVEYIATTYGCTCRWLAKAGVSWEYTDTDVESAEDVTKECGVGYTNMLIEQASGTLITAWDYVVIMLGTNCYTLGTLADTSSDFDTMCGAMRYCMEKLCYYGRQIKIGVVVPIRNSINYNPSATLAEMPTKFQYVQEIARQYAVPTLNMWDSGRIIPNGFTPDGTNYYLGDSVHMGGNGVIQFEKILGNWIAYEL